MEQKVRRGVYKLPFTHWLPMYFNQRHAKNLVEHERMIAELCQNSKMCAHLMCLRLLISCGIRSCRSVFNPLMVLKVLPALLNTCVVQIMKGNCHECARSSKLSSLIQPRAEQVAGCVVWLHELLPAAARLHAKVPGSTARGQ